MTPRARAFYVAVALAGCSKQEPAPAASASASSAALTPAPSASATAAPARPWYAGSWVGTYKAERQVMNVPIGGARDWSKDDGQKAAGEGQVKLTVTNDGLISGSAEGALGKHVVRGSALEQELRLEFLPEAPEVEAFRGVAVTKADGEQQSGELKASSGDSLTVRRASLTLRKEPSGG